MRKQARRGWAARRRWAPAALAAAGAVAYLLVDPRTGDLAAHTFRTELFGREGFTLWNGQWFGGHPTPAYSVLFPPLAWIAGPMFVGALAAVAAADLFARIVRGHFGERAWLGSAWFALGTTSVLFADRLPFMLGVAVGLGSLLALQMGRIGPAALLAAACSLASPVAGLFLALAGVAHALAGRLRAQGSSWRPGAWVAAGAFAPPVALSLAFPGEGYEPFGFGAFWRILAFGAICLLLLPRREPALRIGAALYVVAGLAAFVIETPMGTNAVRLGALFGGPILACVLLAGPRRRAAPTAIGAVALLALAVWQWDAPVRETARAASDPSTDPGYYEPLLGFLERAGPPAGRVEVPLTRTHWEVAEVAARHPIARGWERQVDRGRNEVLYDPGLDDAAYERWLRENAVRFVALPSAGIDPQAARERDIVAADPSYLEQRWESAGWRVYEVRAPMPIVSPERGASVDLAELRSDEAVLDFERPGAALVRVRWTPYWRAAGACVEPAGDWTRVTAARPGRVRLVTSFSPERLVARGRRCD